MNKSILKNAAKKKLMKCASVSVRLSGVCVRASGQAFVKTKTDFFFDAHSRFGGGDSDERNRHSTDPTLNNDIILLSSSSRPVTEKIMS